MRKGKGWAHIHWRTDSSPLFLLLSLVPRAAFVTLAAVSSGMETVCASEVDRHVLRSAACSSSLAGDAPFPDSDRSRGGSSTGWLAYAHTLWLARVR